MPHDTLFITDLHGNLDALRRAVDRAEQSVMLRYIVLGGDLAPNLVTVRLIDGEFVLRHEACYSAKVANAASECERRHNRLRPTNRGRRLKKKVRLHPWQLLTSGARPPARTNRCAREAPSTTVIQSCEFVCNRRRESLAKR